MMPAELGDFLNLLVAVAFLLLLIAVGNRKSIDRLFGAGRPVADGSVDEPYRIYTTKFDRQIAARDVTTDLSQASPDFGRGWFQTAADAHNIAADAADRIVDAERVQCTAALSSLSADYFRNAAVTLLVDHSGSMRGAHIEWAAATTRLVAEMLLSLGSKVELLGYSTAGWHGGYAYRKWLADKRPKQPGRLAAILHIVYRAFDDNALDVAAWRTMLDPNLLRENIDGEALEWAAVRLALRHEPHKLLIIVSDGAPVDDATLMHNGPSYLYRHLMKIIAKIQSDQLISLGAVGIGYRVNEYYPVSVAIEDAREIPAAIAELLIQMSLANRQPLSPARSN